MPNDTLAPPVKPYPSFIWHCHYKLDRNVGELARLTGLKNHARNEKSFKIIATLLRPCSRLRSAMS